MALDPIVLDDLDWKGMVNAIRARIAAASDGEWTLHAPVDPGVTMLELFAWQLEQRLYRMDQVPAELHFALLALLGHRPRRTRCARSVLEVTAGQGAIARGAEFSLEAAEPALVYSSCAGQALLRMGGDPVRLWTGERERTLDLTQGRVFALLPADGKAASARIELTLTEPPAAGGWFGIYLGLRSAAAIAPQWSPDAAEVAPPARLEWLYRAAGGGLRPFVSDDGTAGLRRSGVLRLRAPADWRSEDGAGRYAIHLRTAKASFSAPPRLSALRPNALIARDARRGAPIAARLDWLALPGNVIRLDQLAPGEAPIVESGCVLYLREKAAGWRQWWPALSLHQAGPERRAFVVDRARGQLRFGDGLRGRLPVLADDGADNLRLRCLFGGGSERVAGAGASWLGADGLRARSLVESLGGTEAETLEQARHRSAAGLRLATRAVTRPDLEMIALATPGVALKRAHAAVGRHPRHPCAVTPGAVTVFLVPDVPRDDVDDDLVEDAWVAAPLPDPGMLAAVAQRLDRARLIGTEVFVAAPRYHPVALRAWLRGEVGDSAGLRRRIVERLRRFLDPLTGGAEGDGWPFGEPLRPSLMLREVQAAAGPQLHALQVAVGIDGAEPSETCAAVPIGPHDLVWLATLDLRLDRSAAGAGGLR